MCSYDATSVIGGVMAREGIIGGNCKGPEEKHEGVGEGGLLKGNDLLPVSEETRKKWSDSLREMAPILEKYGGYEDALGQFLRKIREMQYKPELDWKSILQEAVTEACGPVHYTFNRPSRRFISSGTYIPTRVKEKAPCSMAVGIDVSGSMTDAEIGKALKEIDEITEDYPDMEKDLSWISTEMDGPHKLVGRYQDNPVPIRSTGGTFLSPFFEYYAEHDGEESKHRVTAVFSDLKITPEDKSIIKDIVNRNDLQNIYWITNEKGVKGPVGTTIEYSPNPEVKG